jgi:peptide/nickel transport system permease protein
MAEARTLAEMSEMRGARRRQNRLRRMISRMQGAAVAAVMLIVIVLVALAAPLLAPHAPGAVRVQDRLLPPLTESHPLGTDGIGQDVLSRVIYGARISLIVGVLAVLISGSIGIVFGLISGYYGRWLDSLIMRIADIQLAFPVIILYIAVLAVLGPGLYKLIIVMGIVSWVPYGRVQRGMVLSVKEQEYVQASRAIGAPDYIILARHILPNTLGPMIVVASFGVAIAIITEASLSFLGLGVPPSIPSWGSMLSDGRNYLHNAWWIATFPGIAITITVLAVNLLGDWIRDELDPLLRVQ